MNAEFNWWLLIVGLVVGAGLVWFVVMDTRRRESELDAVERPMEAAWLAASLNDEGWDVPPEAVERLLALHRAYLEAPPPDEPRPDELNDQEAPTITGAASIDAPPASVTDTPNVESSGRDPIDPTSPTQ